MTQEEKQLLLIDLCSRLPYGVIMTNKKLKDTYYPLDGNEWQQAYYDDDWDDVPYLRSMSSMTEEEKKEYASFISGKKPFDSDFSVYLKEYGFVYEWDVVNYINWLNSRHFDYRGLIEKGLALEAPEGMYNK